jgi:hypothetical protein
MGLFAMKMQREDAEEGIREARVYSWMLSQVNHSGAKVLGESVDLLL